MSFRVIVPACLQECRDLQASSGTSKSFRLPSDLEGRTLRLKFWAVDLKQDIAGIVLNRWGHAFVNPQPGFFFGTGGKPAARDLLRKQPFGRIAFAQTDLSGTIDHLSAIAEAHRAVYQIWGAVS
jgi:hypothetical protein